MLSANIDADKEGIECFTLELELLTSPAADQLGDLQTADVCVIDKETGKINMQNCSTYFDTILY